MQREHEGGIKGPIGPSITVDLQICTSTTEAAEQLQPGKQMETQPIERGREVDRMPRDPSPEEIRQRCKAIQAEWTPKEESRRAKVTKRAWRPPTVHIAATVREPGIE